MAKAIRIVSLLAVLLLILLAIPSPRAEVSAWAPTLSDVWVAPPPIGDDTNNDGSEAHPFATIKHGLQNVVDDGTVHVAAGTYPETFSISSGKNLVSTADAQNTIIDGGGSGHVIYISGGAWSNTISGFTIQNGYVTASLWNPAGEQVLFAGINLDSIKMLPRLFNASGLGGGIYISGGHTVTLNDCVIKNNQARDGGGIYNDGVMLTMNGCTVSNNSATRDGGGIYNNTEMWLTNCTISGNSASNGGGGIDNYMGAEMNLSYVTIANNQATGASALGGGFENVGPATFMNTIVANNTAGAGVNNNGYNVGAQGGTIQSNGYNLDSENSCGFDQPTDLINTDPLLGPLQDNGGPTSTHALLHGSPAIDAGSCVAILMDHVFAAVVLATGTDQRGTPRPQGANCDIGAYELTQGAVTTATGTGTASFSTLNGYITGLTALNESALTCPEREDLDFPNGLFSFTVNGITPGSSATVVIILPSVAPVGTQYWKCINGQWVDCTSNVGSDDGDNVVMITLVDNGPCDADPTPGVIADPGGPAVAAAPAPAGLPAGPGASPTIPRPLNPSDISLQYLSITPQQTSAGQPVTITTNVVNTGDEAGNYNVTLKINGQVEEAKMVSVGPQGTQPVKFTVIKDQPGTYSVDVLGKTGSFTILGAGSTTGSNTGGVIALAIIGVLVLATLVVLLIRRT
jgi:hypothetical protein